MARKTPIALTYTQADIAEVSDNPPLTTAELTAARPFVEIFPDLAKSIARRGPQKAPTKELISIRLNSATLAAFRALGPGWQKRIDETLTAAAQKLHSP